jgi:cell division protein FtsB
MFRKGRGMIILGGGLILIFLIFFANKDYFVTEHLVNLTTTTTLKAELEKTNKNVAKLEKELKDMNEKAAAQAGEAAAAKAQLAAMN